MEEPVKIDDWESFLEEIGDTSISPQTLMAQQSQAAVAFQKLEQRLQEELDKVLDAPLPVGYIIEKFKVTSRLGRGGMSQVYLAKRNDGLFDQQVAIKLLSPELLEEHHQAFFDNERKILARLNHPNISKIMDGGMTEDDIPYFVMEYIDGVPLDEYLKDYHVTSRDRIEIFLKICHAVRHAHEKLILHRDLKPSNVFMDKEATVKLLDFGIAGFIEDTDRSTSQGGTINYLPPEHFAHQSYTVRSDVYQLGLLGYMIFEGRHAIQGNNASEVIQKIERGEFSYWQNLRSEPTLKAIFEKCLEVDPENRYDTVDALMIDLEFYLEDKPVKALPANWRRDGFLFLKRNRISVAFSFILFACILSFALWSNIQANRIEKERQKALTANQFLTSIFEANDPSLNNGEEISALTLLQSSEAQLDRLDNTEVKADITKQLGSLYASLGEYNQSIRYAKQAADLFKSNKLSDVGYIESLLVMIKSYSLAGEKYKSDSILSEAIRILTPKKDTYKYLYSALLLESAGSSVIAGALEKGDSIVNLALQSISGGSKDKFNAQGFSSYESPAVLEAQLYCKKSELAIYLSRHDEALDAALAAQKLMEEAAPINYKYAVDPSFYLAMSYYAKGEFEKQKEILEGIIEQDVEVYGAEHPMTWQSLRLIANSYNALGQFEKTDSILYYLLPRFRSFYGETNQYTTNVAFFAARSQMSQGNYLKAKEQFLDVLNDYMELSDTASFAIAYAVGTIYENLGGIDTALGNYPEAESYLEKCEEKYQVNLEEHNVRFVALYRLYGNLYRESGQYQKALKYYDRSLTLSQEVFGESHPMHKLSEDEKSKLLAKMNS